MDGVIRLLCSHVPVTIWIVLVLECVWLSAEILCHGVYSISNWINNQWDPIINLASTCGKVVFMVKTRRLAILNMLIVKQIIRSYQNAEC